MFPIDRSLLPSLSTRRALIVVDPQNDFLAEDGALPINIPRNLPERIANLATAFRKSGGDIIWVCSRFEKSRSTLDEQILTSDRAGQLRSADVSRGRRRQASPQITDLSCECPEAFLTQESSGLPKCVRSGSSGIDMHPTVKEAVGPRDCSVVKSYYSAFKSEQLLKLLRMRLVTELFICGSTTNISIMATAVDAASHGYNISIVEDCCGCHNIMRHRTAIKQISNTTGCDVLTTDEVLASFKPKLKPSRRPGDRPATSPSSKHSSVRRTRGEDNAAASSALDILSSFKNLSLSPGRAADPIDVVEAPTQDSPLPVQPLVSSTKAEDCQESQTSRLASVADAVAVDDDQPEPQNDESQKSQQDSRVDAQPPPTDDKELSPSVTQGDGIVTQHDLKTPSLDKEFKTTVPDTARIKGDEVLPHLPFNLNSESIEPTSETTTESHSKPTDAPPEVLKIEVQDTSTMAHQQIPKLRESEPLCEGDTAVVYDILPKSLLNGIFEKVKNETQWQRMIHQGGEVPRLGAIQCEIGDDGSLPVYRHPMDESPPFMPFSPTVVAIKKEVEKQLGHPVNHVLMQFYRNGADLITEHSDKTIDVVKDTYIANVSLGAERTMTFRTKRAKYATDANAPKRRNERVALPHNSLCKMGLKTNMKWLHSIRPDKRPNSAKSDEQLAYDGARISLTFRLIGTFLDPETKLIWGQGATAKTREEASQVIIGEPSLYKSMALKFGIENNTSNFNWDEAYGEGFDVLHMSSVPRLFLSSDPVVNMRIQLMLAEYGIDYARGSMSPLFGGAKTDGKNDDKAAAADQDGAVPVPEDLPIKFADNDFPKTIVHGETAIMLYLDRVYGQRAQAPETEQNPTSSSSPPRKDLAKVFTRFQHALTLLGKYRAISDVDAFERHLRVWEQYAAEGQDFIAGPTISLADFAFWPVLSDVIRTPGRGEFGEKDGFKYLKNYYERIRSSEAGKKVLVVCASCIRKKPDAPTATSSAGPSSSAPAASASGSGLPLRQRGKGSKERQRK
ncbi:hypothetical protein GGR53DRAFT_503593 [Hypoxylon sp. FL1150]|nr:hypothetical protein GGR53DRAFT_503593 [Hypoxylon sp. FL1150]